MKLNSSYQSGNRDGHVDKGHIWSLVWSSKQRKKKHFRKSMFWQAASTTGEGTIYRKNKFLLKWQYQTKLLHFIFRKTFIVNQKQLQKHKTCTCNFPPLQSFDNMANFFLGISLNWSNFRDGKACLSYIVDLANGHLVRHRGMVSLYPLRDNKSLCILCLIL